MFGRKGCSFSSVPGFWLFGLVMFTTMFIVHAAGDSKAQSSSLEQQPQLWSQPCKLLAVLWSHCSDAATAAACVCRCCLSSASPPTHTCLQARDDKGSAAAIQEELKDVPPLAMMASEIKDEVYDDEDDTLDAGVYVCVVFFG